ncbi:MAG: hypothetical protein KC484_09900 [Colwelliaceae bacterium]|nr:hypothetical protein [Colwelliaceae bacterium]
MNKFSINFNSSSDYINEIFLYFYIGIFERQQLLKLENQKFLDLNRVKDVDFYLWVGAAKSNGIKIPFVYSIIFIFKNIYFLFYSFLVVLITSILLPIYTLFKFKGVKSKKPNQKCQSLAIIRAPATYNKMQFLEGQGVRFLVDDLTFKMNDLDSLYSVRQGFNRILSVIFVPVCSVSDFFKIFLDAKNTVGIGSSGYVLNFYAKRIAHKCNFEFYMNALLKEQQVKTLYTGNKEDRFAILEKKLCKKYAIPCVCIPHGLEYAYKMPGGLVGDDFYCTSMNAKNYLSELYKAQPITFHFDEKIAEKMFSRDIKSNQKRVIVFFPESREPEVNLKIMEFLVAEGFKLHVKLHVKDRLENYLSVINSIELIDSFDEAISHNICLARKSTVLVEALYNDSIAISVLIDNRDKSYVDLMFPSLADPKILRAESFLQLKKILTNLKKEELNV